MKTLISLGDIDEAIYLAKKQGFYLIKNRLFRTSQQRVKSAWNSATSKRRTAWWEIPAVRKRWNKIITGNSETDYLKYLHNNYFIEGATILSPGCGTGEKEIKIASMPKVKRLDAFDIAEKRIAIANEKAKSKNLDNIIFIVADIENFTPQENFYDVILFDSFLHHVQDIDKILIRFLTSLKDDGILVINEYVGQNRFQWTTEQLQKANELLLKIPKHLRKREFDGKIKTKIFRPGILRMILSDPSEAVNSEAILPEIHKHTEIIEEKPYGGNLLQLILKDISHNFINETDENRQVLKFLFGEEDKFIAEYQSDFLFGIYRKKLPD